jgi:hypothetical protein
MQGLTFRFIYFFFTIFKSKAALYSLFSKITDWHLQKQSKLYTFGHDPT